MLIHDILKIKYSREGFLPDYPYHLISDKEMFDAFINEDTECFFYDTYPCVDDTLRQYYDPLVEQIKYHLNQYIENPNKTRRLPDWVYSYMIGSTIGPESDQFDIHDLLVMLGYDNLEDVIGVDAYNEMYKISKQYVRKLKEDEQVHRPPTIFGEPHVLKMLRLEQTSV